MDDANIPSLLSLPYLCPDEISINDSIYQNTRKFILSRDNPWFFSGPAFEGNYLLFSSRRLRPLAPAGKHRKFVGFFPADSS